MTQVRPIDGKCTGCFIFDNTFEFIISKGEFLCGHYLGGNFSNHNVLFEIKIID